MGKISDQARNRFLEHSKEYKRQINTLVEKENKMRLSFKKGDMSTNPKRIELAEDNLIKVSYYVVLNSLSISMLGVKNESYLNEARKCLYKSIIYLEEALTNLIDVPYSEYEDNLKSIEQIDDTHRYHLVRRLGFSIDTVEESFGDNSKWKWSFVELLGRFATVAKNLLDLKSIFKNLDPRIDGYSERMNWITFVKNLLQTAADKYREKYELVTQRIDDIKLAINYLSALKRLHVALNDAPNLEVIKKKIEVWSTKMENDLKKREEEKKNKV
jgi:hypothetical protein